MAELLALRANDIGKIEEPSSANTSSKARACEVALYLSTWDAKAAVPALQLATQRYLEALAQEPHSTLSSESQSLMLQVFLARMKGNDSTAWPEYKTWLRQNTSKEKIFFDASQLATLWQAPQNTAVQAAGEWLLNDKSSPIWDWLQQKDLVYESLNWTASLWDAPSFKSYVIRKLSDTSPLGTLHIHQTPTGQNEGIVEAKNSSYNLRQFPNTYKGQPISSVPFRVCDYYAWQLWYSTHELNPSENFKKAPRFELYWPQRKRDAVLLRSMEFVRNYQLERDGTRY